MKRFAGGIRVWAGAYLVLAFLVLGAHAPTVGEAARPADPAYYVKRGTWQETMAASHEALAAMLKAEEGKGARPFISDVMRGQDPARQVRVNVAGWKELFLIVDDDGNYNHDVANWAEAKLIARDGRETYLDTVEPLSAKQAWGEFRRDNRSTVGGAMHIADRLFKRGLGTHAASIIRYACPADAEFFEAWVGVDVTRRRGEGSVRFIVSNTEATAQGKAADSILWDLVGRDFLDLEARRQMAWEREDRVWEGQGFGPAEMAPRYAGATRGALAARAAELAKRARDAAALQAVRAVYYRARGLDEVDAQLKAFGFPALRRAITDLTRTYGAKYPKGPDFLKRLAALEKAVVAMQQANAAGTGAEERALQTVKELSALREEALLANPLLDFDQLLVVRRKANRLGLPQNWQSNSSLPRSGFDNEIAVMSPVRPGGALTTLYRPQGERFVGDVDLHFDAGRMLFSSLDGQSRWQVFEIGIDGKGLRQVTPGDQPDVDNYDACYLPDERILFTSSACFAGVPCVYGSDHVANLYRMDADGKSIRQLCFDQDHDWCPTVLNNGRVLYLRWEYTDTPHSQTRILFHMNPDGTGQMEYYGSNSYWPNGMFFARPVPGHPTQVAAVISGHHGVPRMGELVLFDPAKGRQSAEGALQRIPGSGKPVEPVTADQLVNGSWPKFLHPYPLSDKYFIVAAQPTAQSPWGVYLVDLFDNMLLLREEPGYALFEPVPVRKTPRPPVVRDRVVPGRKDALVTINDVYLGEGLKGVPRGTVKSLRLFTYHYSYRGMGGLLGVIGMDGPWDIRRVLGTVPVESDGSASFRVPANTPISIQPLDAEGKAVQIMRSWTTAMPGENVSCVGCHERQNTAPLNARPLALSRPPSEIKPWYGPTRGFNYAREVQPVIDRYCVGCHSGQTRPDGREVPDLRGDVRVSNFRMVTPGNGGAHAGKFPVGYVELARYVRRPGIESDYHVLPPKEFHADTTHLVQLLQKGHYGVRLDPEAWDRLITWIDLNAPFHGTWGEELAKPGVQRERRKELLRLYAGIDDDPEEVVPVRYNPGPFVMPPGAPAALAHTPTPPHSQAPAWPFAPDEAARRRAAAGKPLTQSIDLGGGAKMELSLVPAGEYVMGDAAGCTDEHPLTSVRVEKPFWVGRCEVSNAQFARFDPRHDSHVESKQAYQFGVHGYPLDAPEQPVVKVSWQQAMAFCRWLSAKTGKRFTLPSEAQWEWACRAGSAAPFSFGDLGADFSRFANLADKKLSEFASNPYTVFDLLTNPSQFDDYVPKETRFNDGGLVTMPVGSYQPNAWGLHDMHGNVWEWTRTAMRPYPYQEGDGRNGPADGEKRVVRGGSWRDLPGRARAGFRLAYPTWHPVFNVGFRVVCEE